MSVTGEFYRLVEDCIAYLDASGAPQADRWKQQLERAAARGRVALSAAADEALRLLEEDGAPPVFDEPRERDDFARLAEHLAAICRAILGRSADASAESGEGP